VRLRWTGDRRVLRGVTALDCLRDHCHGDHSEASRRGDVDGVMRRIAVAFQLDLFYAELPTLEERCSAFVRTALDRALLIDETATGRRP